MSRPLDEIIEGSSLDELADTLKGTTRDPSGFSAKILLDRSGGNESDRTSITFSMTSNDPHIEVVGRDGQWVARAVRELCAEMAERRIRSPLRWQWWFTGVAVAPILPR